MKPWLSLSLALLLVLVSLTPVQAHSLLDENNPPQPSWLERLLQWLGLLRPTTPASTETVAPPSPTPAPVLEYRIRSLQALEDLPKQLQPGRSTRAYATAADVSAILNEYLSTPNAARNGVLAGQIRLLDGEVEAEGYLARSLFEKYRIPLRVSGESVPVSGRASLTVSNCRPKITIHALKINDRSVPLRGLISDLLNQSLQREWPAKVCLESITISPEGVSAQGYLMP